MKKFGLTEETITTINDVFKRFPAIESVVVYGSRALGIEKPGSDIDLALKGQIDLNLLANIKRILDEELPLPYFFDLLDYNTISNPDLKKHIDQFGKLFYKKRRLYKNPNIA